MEHGRQLAGEGGRPVEQLVEDTADGVGVGAAVDGLAPDLLGRHVGGRADDGVGPGQATGVDQQLGDPEVHHLDLADAGDVDVVRLQVAVDDLVAVSGADGREQLLGDVERLVDGHPPLVLEGGAERLALDELHHDEEGFAVLVEVVDADDARVVQRRDRGCLALEAAAKRRIPRVDVAEDLDRYGDLEPGVEALVDDSHRAAPELGLDGEAAEMVDRRRALRLHQALTGSLPKCPHEDAT